MSYCANCGERLPYWKEKKCKNCDSNKIDSSNLEEYGRFAGGVISPEIIGSTKKYGIIPYDSENWIIFPIYEELKVLDDVWDFCRAKFEGKWGIIDEIGNWKIQPIYEGLGEYDEELNFLPAKINGKWGVIDANEIWQIEPQFDELGSFYGNSFVPAKHQGKWGLLNLNGTWKIFPNFDLIKYFNDEDGLCRVKLDDKWGFINQVGGLVISNDFESLGEFGFKTTSMGILCPAKYNNRWGFIDTNGEWKIMPIYEEISDSNDYCKTLLAGNEGFFDSNGKWFDIKFEEFRKRRNLYKENSYWLFLITSLLTFAYVVYNDIAEYDFIGVFRVSSFWEFIKYSFDRIMFTVFACIIFPMPIFNFVYSSLVGKTNSVVKWLSIPAFLIVTEFTRTFIFLYIPTFWDWKKEVAPILSLVVFSLPTLISIALYFTIIYLIKMRRPYITHFNKSD